jgi:restriction system protein
LGGQLSFHVIFQSKRYRGSISVSQVRDFRGAMVGRADKGLPITTGNFTRDATRGAVREGVPAIDLIDGDVLVKTLKGLGLGVRTEVVQTEQVSVDRHWFGSIWSVCACITTHRAQLCLLRACGRGIRPSASRA